MADFTHFTQDGRPQMVNVGEKDETQRIAIATGKVLVGKATLSAIAEGGLKKGDVLLWHPSLIHGSSNQQVNGFSRKSLTAHYHPISFKQGGGGVETSVSSDIYNKSIITTMSKMRKFDNLPIYTFNRWETTKSSLKGLIKYFTGFKNSENSLMQRDAYDFKKSR